jgi:hypothetical protein
MLIVLVAVIRICRNRPNPSAEHTMEKLLTLKDAAAVLNVKPYRIGYVLAVKLVPEPALRVGNKRVFDQADIQRLADHFRVKLASTTTPTDPVHASEPQTHVCAAS